MALAWTDIAIVSTDGGPDVDYTSMVTFESDYDGVATINGETLTAKVRGAVAHRQYWAGWQAGMDADTRILITYTDGNQATGPNMAGDKAVITNDTSRRIEEATNPIVIDFVGVELRGDGGDIGIYFRPTQAGSELKLINCVMDSQGDGIYIIGIGDVYIGGTLFVDCGNGSYHHEAVQIVDADCTLSMTQCTIYDALGDGVYQTAGTCLVENTAVAQCTPDFSGTITENNTLSEDDGDIVNTAGVDWTNAPNWDFTVADSDSKLYQAGKAQPSWYTDWTSTDMAGTTWNDTPSVGCYELAGGEPPAGDTRGGGSRAPVFINSAIIGCLWPVMGFVHKLIKNPTWSKREWLKRLLRLFY